MIEDDLRAVMRAHDEHAPRVESFAAPPVRRRAAAPMVAAVVVTALVVALIALLWTRPAHRVQTAGRTPQGSTTKGSARPAIPAALVCPLEPSASSSPNGWVPAKPQTRAPGTALVPHVLPQAVVVCSYTGRFPTTGPHADTLLHPKLAGERSVGGNLLSVTDSLSRVPRGAPGACEDYLAIPDDSEYYLIGVLIDGKRTWVAAPGDHCKGTTNGVFLGRTNLRRDAQQAYDWGRWDTDESQRRACTATNDPSAPAQLRRDPIRLTVCTDDPRGWLILRTTHPGNDAVDRYNAALAARSKKRCGMSALPFDFSARLDYADGSSSMIGGDMICIDGPGDGFLAGNDLSSVVNAFTQDPFGDH
jgi:hypothetical protein